MHPNEPYHNIFLGRACPEPPSHKMAQRYAQHNASGMYYNTSPLSQKVYPMFEHGLLPLIKMTIHSGTPSPPPPPLTK